MGYVPDPYPYDLVARMLQITSLKGLKLARSVTGRIGAGERWSRWVANTQLGNLRIWVHAASVGEGLVAEPVMVRLARSTDQTLTAIRTYTSSSAMTWPAGFPYDHGDFLPSRGVLTEMMRHFRPSMMIYPRADLWPALVERAARSGVPQIVIGGSVRGDSQRLRWPARLVTRRMVRRLATVGAVSTKDARSWERLGAPPDRIVVTGDPRDTQVLDRVSSLNWTTALSGWAGGHFILLAGSTHRTDEGHILEAAARLQGRTIIVPHEPTPATIRRIVEWCSRTGLSHTVSSAPETVPNDQSKLLIVDARGGLQDLYALASVALVGGGFDGGRVHSLSEPAAMGVPILVGPGGMSDPSANRFLQSGGVRLVKDSEGITAACQSWQHEQTRRAAGLSARAVLSAGAAAKTVQLIRHVLDQEGGV